LRDLTSLLIESYIVERLQQVCFATVSKELGILKAAYRCASRWGWTAHSPFVGIVLNQEGTTRSRWISHEEELRLLAHCTAELRDLVMVGLDTGLRPGNLVGLRWTWVQASGTCLIVPREHTKTKILLLTIPMTTRVTDIVGQAFKHGHSE